MIDNDYKLGELYQQIFDDCFNINGNVVSTLYYGDNGYGDYQYYKYISYNLDWYTHLNITSKDLSASMPSILLYTYLVLIFGSYKTTE